METSYAPVGQMTMWSHGNKVMWWLKSMDTVQPCMCVDTLQTVEAGCYGQVAVAYTDHHTCTWSALYYQTQMLLEWK